VLTGNRQPLSIEKDQIRRDKAKIMPDFLFKNFSECLKQEYRAENKV